MFEFLKQWLDSLEFDFVSYRYIAGAISGAMVLAAWIAFIVIGPNWGIDFTGGTEIHLRFDEDTSITDVRSALTTLGLSDDAVQSVNGADSNEFMIRIQEATFGMEGLEEEFKAAVAKTFGETWAKDVLTSAEVSARFEVAYEGEILSHQTALDKLKENLPAVSSAVPGKDDHVLVFEVSGLADRIQAKIQEAMHGKSFEVLSTDSVGPKVGGELRRQGFLSIAATLGLVLLYVAFRFDIGFAPGAIVALFHDVSITVGIFVIANLEFNLPMIGALLTIVGYSLNDTIVIYDRIRENKDRYRRKDIVNLINVSINETLTRTVATSVTTILAITMFLLIGGPVIRNFALAMFLGIIFGTYSTVFVASPMILIMEDVKPHLAKLIALPIGDDDPEDVDGAMAAVHESEKRRRAQINDETPVE